MRILYHHRTRAEDAQGIHIRRLSEAFERLGHEVELVGLLVRRKQQKSGQDHHRDGPALFNFTIPHWFYEFVALGYNVPAFVVLLWRAYRFRPDVIYERYSLFSASGYFVARLMGVPFILEVNAPLSLEMSEHGELTFKRLARRMENWLCQSATRMIVVSGAMEDVFRRQGVTTDNVLVMPNGVDKDRFNPQLDGRDVRVRYGLEGRFVVGFVGWIRPWHGVDTLIEALAQASGEYDGLHLLIVGDGPAVPDLKERVKALGLTERVVFTGAVSDASIPEHIAAMDVAVQPNVTEYASPIKLFEYLAVGKAVIAPDKANIREVVSDGKSALIYPTGDISALAKRIDRLHCDTALRQQLGANAAVLIDQRGYTWQGNAQRVIDAVAQVNMERAQE